MEIKNKYPFANIQIKKYKSFNDLDIENSKINYIDDITNNDIESSIEQDVNLDNTNANHLSENKIKYTINIKFSLNMCLIWTLLLLCIIVMIIAFITS